MTIKVLIVDDSALIRKLLTELINKQPDMQAIGAAPDPIVAREMIKALNPDVLTLDVEMPKMDGLSFLEKLMRLRPMPVLMVSTLTAAGSEVTLRALELGAVDFVAKPKMDIVNGLQSYSEEIAEKIRAVASAKIRRLPSAGTASATASAATNLGLLGSTEKIIAVGSSTGGTEAVKEFLAQLPPDCPGILVTQHMPEAFTKSFAERLDRLCPRLTVHEASGGERVLPGHVFIAPGHSHLVLKRSGANYVTELSQSAPVSRHRPSVDVLFQSVAKVAGVNAIGVILTGMGKDGAAGMLEMKQAGAYNYAQDEESCVVFGMPRVAIEMGGVDEVVPLKSLGERIVARLLGTRKLGMRV
ncbi:chemotaxis response regulator protein-glutamate methylesterase [Methylococcus sp. EFPC2]|uniref:protein-glutamate methylesterase/protein-glutamine glutaminase n=1 Tax=Methylococcus sp. EFPC2 TaxID=2812648 RepID=UPI00196849B5|nr:chemotaxis response regulator protein-glutamate methylesterase [Methylococcus sp. EFPC2]QSA98688.1 chemotaxis response regulator protein-glutamate methylesterase [Methylococcus sp. EFPC2]